MEVGRLAGVDEARNIAESSVERCLALVWLQYFFFLGPPEEAGALDSQDYYITPVHVAEFWC